jgi:hypothetical protein
MISYTLMIRPLCLSGMFQEKESWAAWAAGRYLIGTIVAVVFGIFPLLREEWFGLIPMVVGGVFLIRTRQRHFGHKREVATADVDAIGDLDGISLRSASRVSRRRSRV